MVHSCRSVHKHLVYVSDCFSISCLGVILSFNSKCLSEDLFIMEFITTELFILDETKVVEKSFQLEFLVKSFAACIVT